MHFITLSSLFVSLAAAFVVPRQAPLLPSQDPFYTQPGNIASYRPGQVINKREVTKSLSGILTDVSSISNLKSSYQYLYRTTDSLGNPVAAVTTLLIPNKANNNKLLAYQTAYDSANNNCSPSYGLRNGANVTEIADIYFINEALDRGWYVMTADFEGLQAQFAAGVQSGYATLDSVRVALNDASATGLSPSAKYALWGYSGGSIACEWAAELQPRYAPELNFQGAALGGLIPNVQNVVQTINGGIFSGLAFSGTYGLAKAYPATLAYLQSQLIPSKAADFYNIANGCLTQSVLGGAIHDLYSYFQSGMAIFAAPQVQAAITAGGIMGTHGTPKMPIFAYKAIGDEISPAIDTTALVNKLCLQGATIEYQENTVGEHFTELLLGAGSAIGWVSDRLDGIPVATNQGRCVTKVVTITALDVVAFANLGAEAIAFLQSLL